MHGPSGRDLGGRRADLRADAEDRGWSIDYTLPSSPRARGRIDAVGIEFTERMVGHISTRVLDDFGRAEQDGRDGGSTFEVVLHATNRGGVARGSSDSQRGPLALARQRRGTRSMPTG